MIKRYDSISALRADAIRTGGIKGVSHNWGNSSWYGDETPEQTLSRSETGDMSLVPEAERLISQLETQIETPRRIWGRSPVGVFCAVPDVLAGLPTPMRRMSQTLDEYQPIEIFSINACSAALSAQLMQQRGTTILALVLALARIRPISLYVVDIGDGSRDNSGETVEVARVETAPLDLAQACYVLTSIGFTRRLMYGLAEKLNGFTGRWPSSTTGWNYNNPQPYYDKLLSRIALNKERSLLIPGAQLGDELLNSPVTWLNTQIRRLVQTQEEAYA